MIEPLRHLPGATAGLPQKTALATLHVIGDGAAWCARCQPDAAALATFARDWPVHVDGSLLRIGWGAHQSWFDSGFTGHLAAHTARDKPLTSRACIKPDCRYRRWRAWATGEKGAGSN